MKSPENKAEVSVRPVEGRSRLGRGLAALLADTKGEQQSDAGNSGVKSVPIEFIRTSSRNPRKQFAETDLDDLASSIKERGIIQPIVVRPISGTTDLYEIVAGERRWRAAQRAGLHSIPIITMQINDREALELSIIENVQRSDLNALEESKGYAQLAAEYGYSHADIGRIIGKSRSYVANMLRLLALPEHTKELLSSGAISAGHARALLAVNNPDAVAEKIVQQGLTVRDIEKLNTNSKAVGSALKPVQNEGEIEELAKRVSLILGLQVLIKSSGEKHTVKIKCEDTDQFNFLIELIESGHSHIVKDSASRNNDKEQSSHN